MRQIKFRAISHKWDKMVYPNDPELRIDICAEGGVHSIWMDSIDEEGVTIMQYTGLKDKNGVEIYEGDILEATGRVVEWSGRPPQSKMPSGRQRVDFKDGMFIMRRGLKSRKYRLFSISINWNGFEVIGNIYENPELLK